MTIFFYVVASLLFILPFYFIRRKSKKLPPGPWFRFPIVGHLPLLGENPHRKLLAWKKIYGPIISVKLGSFQACILIDGKIIRDAFTSANFSGRCAIKPFVDASCNKGIIFGDTPCHFEHRDFFLKNLKNYASSQIEEKVQDEMGKFMDWVKGKAGESGRNLITVNEMFHCPIINSSWSILMGERFENGDTKLNHLGSLITSGFFQADTFAKKMGLYIPWLAKYFPTLTGYYETCGSLREIYAYIQHRLEQRKLTWIKDDPRDITDVYFDTTARTTNVSSAFHEKNDAQKFATGEMFFAALDPTGKTLEWIMYYLAKDQSILRKFQLEIDTIVGPNRLPSLSDRPRMPYSMAIVNELLRITTTGVMAMMHRTTADISDFYGYHIPKDTMVISNLWGCTHDPGVWDEPEEFRPERFLGESGGAGRKFENMVPFGVGKRNCIGEGVARDQIFLIATTLFQKFDVDLPLEDSPPVKTIYGLNLSAETFQVKITERDLAK